MHIFYNNKGLIKLQKKLDILNKTEPKLQIKY